MFHRYGGYYQDITVSGGHFNQSQDVNHTYLRMYSSYYLSM